MSSWFVEEIVEPEVHMSVVGLVGVVEVVNVGVWPMLCVGFGAVIVVVVVCWRFMKWIVLEMRM